MHEEFAAIQLAHACNLTGKLEAVFLNGEVYQFIPGRMITFEELRTDDIARYELTTV